MLDKLNSELWLILEEALINYESYYPIIHLYVLQN